MNISSSQLLFRILVVFFCTIAFLNGSAQKESEVLSKHLESIQINLPADKLFMHTDRNLYRPGDTIFFQSYIEDRFTQKFETSSLSSWVLLLNTEGETIDSARFRIEYSMAPGWLSIPEDCIPGWYLIKSFTSQMQNYDPSFAFSRWIRIDELIKEKVSFEYLFNQKTYRSKDTVEVNLELKDQNGEPLKNTSFSYSTIVGNDSIITYRTKTTRKGKSLLRVYLPDSINNKNASLDISLEKGLGEFRVNIPRQDENPEIRFLPEGGTFISGYSQKIAFNAVSQSGEQLYLSGVIHDNLDNFIDSIKSGRLGPGLVQFTPEKGRKYHAEFNEYPNKKWIFPDVSETDPSIQVRHGKDCLFVHVSGGNEKEIYYLALTKNYNLVAFTPFSLYKQKRIKFYTDSLPPGMAKVTLFNKELKAIAERTFFIPRKNAPYLTLSPEFEFYYPEQQTVLDIEILNEKKNNIGGLFSVAVVDSATALSSQLLLKNIEDEFLFDNEFYKRLPFRIKQEGLTNISDKELDIILLTYDWKKFNWSVPDKEKQNRLVNYDQYKIDVTQVLSARKRKKISNAKDPLFVLSLEEPALINLNKQKNNSYILAIDSVSLLTKSVMLVPNFSVKRKVNAAKVEPVINNAYFEFFGNRNERPKLININHSGIINDPIINLDSFRVLKDISVFAKRTPAKKFVNEYEKLYQGVTTKTVEGVRLESAMTLEDILRRLGAGRVDTYTKKINLRGGVGGSIMPNGHFEKGALFVLDGMPVEKSYKSMENILPSHIHSVTALMGVSGFFIYGEEALGGVVFIETRLNHIGDEYELPQKSINRGDLRKVIQLFRPDVEFYNPPKEVIKDNPEYWIRPTLFWSPEVFYDGITPVKIQYQNHKKTGTVFIIVNGVTIDGKPVSGIHKYKIM